jgi:hypothetical protein
MDDSLVLARLTIMLLRASLPHAESLPATYGIIMTPESLAVTRDAALVMIGKQVGLHSFEAVVSAGNLVVTVTDPTPLEEIQVGRRVEMFMSAIRSRPGADAPEALIEVEGYDESVLVTVSVLERWFRLANCRRGSIRLAEVPPRAGGRVVAEIELGRHRERAQ